METIIEFVIRGIALGLGAGLILFFIILGAASAIGLITWIADRYF